jgi:hypothetical protein
MSHLPLTIRQSSCEHSQNRLDNLTSCVQHLCGSVHPTPARTHTSRHTSTRSNYAQQAAREWPRPTYCLLWILTCCTVTPLTSRADHTREQPCSSLTSGVCVATNTAHLRTEQLQLFPCCPVVPVPPLILLVFTIFSVPSVHEEASGPVLSARCSYTLHGSFIQAGGAHL